MSHTLSPNTVRKLLRQLGYGRRANRKANDGHQHADRDAQFEHINAQSASRLTISRDLGRHQKKELVGCKRNSAALRTAGVGRSTLYRVLKLMDDSVMVASGAE